MKLDSGNEFSKLKDSMLSEDLEKSHSEFASPKLVSCYLFERKTETYVKNARRKAMRKIPCIGKTDKVNNIFQQLVDSGDSYLRH